MFIWGAQRIHTQSRINRSSHSPATAGVLRAISVIRECAWLQAILPKPREYACPGMETNTSRAITYALSVQQSHFKPFIFIT